MEEAVALREVEQAIAKSTEDGSATRCLRVEGAQVEIEALLAVVAERGEDRGEVLRPGVTIEVRHVGDDPRDHRVQPGVELRQVASVGDEALERLGLPEVSVERGARGDHPQREDVGERIVVTDRVLPRHVSGQVHRAFDRFLEIADREVGHPGGVVAPESPLDAESGPRLRLESREGDLGAARLDRLVACEEQSSCDDLDLLRAFERCNPAAVVQGGHLLEQR